MNKVTLTKNQTKHLLNALEIAISSEIVLRAAYSNSHTEETDEARYLATSNINRFVNLSKVLQNQLDTLNNLKVRLNIKD